MQTLSEFHKKDIRFLFTDIDDTLTKDGKLHAEAYTALWELHDGGIKIVPITGRPAGWCEMIARFWPVDGVVGENGGFYFRYHDRTMKRYFAQSEAERARNRLKLNDLCKQILHEVPKAAVSSDQFARLLDLSIDMCEDIAPLSDEDIQKIVFIFTSHGAQCKISSIHVNGWFGNFDKLSMCKEFLRREHQISENVALECCAFVGDSPNDEPMFSYFPISFGVANVRRFQNRMKHLPSFVASSEGGDGFAEVARALLATRT